MQIAGSILVIEGRPDQAQLITEALATGTAHQVFYVNDQTSAWAFLQQQGDYTQAPRPDLILLDLQLPDGEGQQFLNQVKSNPALQQIPIVVLSHSDEPKDIFQSYANHSNCYVIKSQDITQLTTTIQKIESFWLGIVTLPLKS